MLRGHKWDLESSDLKGWMCHQRWQLELQNADSDCLISQVRHHCLVF